MRPSHNVDEKRRMTRIPHTILVQLLALLENPSQMTVVDDNPDYRVFMTILQYSDSMSVRAYRSMCISNDRVLVDSWDLEWIQNPDKQTLINQQTAA